MFIKHIILQNMSRPKSRYVSSYQNSYFLHLLIGGHADREIAEIYIRINVSNEKNKSINIFEKIWTT